MEAMKLEIERLQLNLSAAERDRALLSIGTDPASINPNVLLDESYMGRLSSSNHSCITWPNFPRRQNCWCNWP